jgi:hypothetical protein
LVDQVREGMRIKHYSLRTERTYWDWIKRFIFFHQKRHPREMGAGEVGAFLSNLAVWLRVAVLTQNQALNGLVFLYREVLHLELGAIDGVVRPKPLWPALLFAAGLQYWARSRRLWSVQVAD